MKIIVIIMLLTCSVMNLISCGTLIPQGAGIGAGVGLVVGGGPGAVVGGIGGGIIGGITGGFISFYRKHISNIPYYVRENSTLSPITRINGRSNRFEYVVSGENKSECFIVGYTGKDKNVNIPEKLNGRKVVGITGISYSYKRYENKTYFNGAFSAKGLTNVTISETVRIIGENAFSANSFKSVTIPNSVSEIGDRAFSYPVGSIIFTIKGRLTNVGEDAFGELTEYFYFTGGNPGVYSDQGATLYNGEVLPKPALIICQYDVDLHTSKGIYIEQINDKHIGYAGFRRRYYLPKGSYKIKWYHRFEVTTTEYMTVDMYGRPDPHGNYKVYAGSSGSLSRDDGTIEMVLDEGGIYDLTFSASSAQIKKR